MYVLYAPLLIVAIAFTTYFLHGWRPISWLLAYFLGVNGVTFVAYIWDKIIACPSKSCLLNWMRLRVPNWVLFWLLGALGGTIGAGLGMAVGNHKTSSDYAKYRAGLGAIFVIQVITGIWLALGDWPVVAALDATIEWAVTAIVQFTSAVVTYVASAWFGASWP